MSVKKLQDIVCKYAILKQEEHSGKEYLICDYPLCKKYTELCIATKKTGVLFKGYTTCLTKMLECKDNSKIKKIYIR
jgi:hypothetical protein